MRFAKWLFLGPALIHLWWARCVWRSDTPLFTTGLTDLYAIFGYHPTALALSLFVVSALAIASIVAHSRWPVASLFMLLPQQATMVASAYTAARCIRAGTFADGLPYNPDFISADQCYLFVIGLAHTALIVHVYLWDGLVAWVQKSFGKGTR